MEWDFKKVAKTTSHSAQKINQQSISSCRSEENIFFIWLLILINSVTVIKHLMKPHKKEISFINLVRHLYSQAKILYTYLNNPYQD